MECSEYIDETIRVFEDSIALARDPSDQSLLNKQVLALKKIKESLSKCGSMKFQISNFEKLISNTWMNDQKIFDKTYHAWENFRLLYEKSIGGMTVNERLSYVGLLEEFEKGNTDESKARSILREVFVTGDNADEIINSL